MVNKDSDVQERASEWFIRLRDGAISEAEKSDFQLWLNENPQHQSAYREVERLWQALDQIPTPHLTQNKPETKSSNKPITIKPAPNKPNKVTLPTHHLPTQRSSKWLNRAFITTCALAIMSGVYVNYFPEKLAEYQTSSGEQRTLKLSDGSTLRLNTDTALSTTIDNHQRRIKLYTGEAQFNIAADSKRPFYVETHSHTVTVLGTGFNLKLDDKKLDLIVTEHSVKITNSNGHSTVVHSGQGTRATRNTYEKIPSDRLSTALAWQQGRLVFVNQPLIEVLNELDRYHPGRIVLMDELIENTPITGTFKSIDSSAVLEAIEKTQPVRFVRLGDWLTLVFAK